MYPFVKSLLIDYFYAFQFLFVPLQEEGVVFWDFGSCLRLQKVELDCLLRKRLPSVLGLGDQRLLEVALSAENL